MPIPNTRYPSGVLQGPAAAPLRTLCTYTQPVPDRCAGGTAPLTTLHNVCVRCGPNLLALRGHLSLLQVRSGQEPSVAVCDPKSAPILNEDDLPCWEVQEVKLSHVTAGCGLVSPTMDMDGAQWKECSGSTALKRSWDKYRLSIIRLRKELGDIKQTKTPEEKKVYHVAHVACLYLCLNVIPQATRRNRRRKNKSADVESPDAADFLPSDDEDVLLEVAKLRAAKKKRVRAASLAEASAVGSETQVSVESQE